MKIGILSFAHHHGEAYISNLRRMDNVELFGVADDDTTRGQTLAKQHEARYFPSYEALLETKPDGVIIWAFLQRRLRLELQRAQSRLQTRPDA